MRAWNEVSGARYGARKRRTAYHVGADDFGGTRSAQQCMYRYLKVRSVGVVAHASRWLWLVIIDGFCAFSLQVLKPGLVKGPWSREEDDTVRRLVMVRGLPVGRRVRRPHANACS